MIAVHISPLCGNGPALQKRGIIDYYGIILKAAEPQVKGERAKVKGLKGSGIRGRGSDPAPAPEFEDEDQDDDEDER